MWQYSSTGKIDGIDSEVDLNICFTKIADYD
jgi:GH25 family lysozyme M1 (1,4-beta-N-acetylmuramidase)